jgi:hypothetical protein
MEILACGNDTTNIKLFFGFLHYDSISTNTGLAIMRYDRNGEFEDQIFYSDSPKTRDFAMASDDLHPALNSNPFSLALIFSKGTYSKDSIIILSSNNGGMSFNSKYRIASSSKYFHKVALAYGRSPSFSSGRYFAAWEEQDNEDSVSGHIYTSHSEPNFNSPFTTPIRVDSVDASAANNASNPVIACQNNAIDNDSANLTEVLLFEKYLPASQKFTVGGLYNKKAANSNNFQKFTIDVSGDNILHPDLCFNPFDSTFIVTYFDSTTQKLPYYTHNFNMNNPDAWGNISEGYNDINYLLAPHPQVITDFGTHTGANAWIGNRADGKGAALFDAPFIYYTGIPEINDPHNSWLTRIYPNPASEFVNLEFELDKADNVRLDLHSSIGQPIASTIYPSCKPGKNQVRFNLSGYDPGIYMLIIKAGDKIALRKVSVIR